MIQSILFFVLGFLSAAFIVLLVAPSVWRRAVVLTRRRIEASVPMTLNEIQAEKDRMRAEYAMTIRRLEIAVQSQKEKAAAQIVELNRNREEIKLLAEECAAKSQTIAELEVRASEAGAAHREMDERVEKLEQQISEAGRRLEERALEMENLARRLDEANFTASNRQIELVARETEIDKLVGDINILRGQLRETEKRAREISAENKATLEALRAERKRAADMEKKIERLGAELSDREERIDRREKEVARLREATKEFPRVEQELKARLKEAETQRDRLQVKLARNASVVHVNGRPESAAVMAVEHSNERARLEERLNSLVRENKKLRAELSNSEEPRSGAEDDSVLRTQIHSLAAEVVNLTAMLEGADSPIRQALEAAGGVPSGAGTAGEGIPSLAERIRALQQAVPQQRPSLPS